MVQALRHSIFTVALLATSLIVLHTPALSAGAKSKPSVDEIKTRLQMSFDGIKFEHVMPSVMWPGFYEVATDTELLYTNSEGSQLFVGNIIDTSTRENLTAKRWRELNKVDVARLPVQDAIKKVKGNGSRKMYVFSDPDCPYCKRLEQTLQEVDNVTIYIFLYPLEDLHPNARVKSDQIWCSSNQIEAWDQWMLQGVQASASCEQSVVDRNLKLGGSFKINGTPAIFFADGQRVDGAIPKQQIEEALAAKPAG